jgi:hypothetical protein
MNFQPEEDLRRRWQNLEAKIKSAGVTSHQKTGETSPSNFAEWTAYLQTVRTWFDDLSKAKKIAALGVVMVFSTLILQALFKLVASVISLAVLALLVYLGYKFFLSNKFQNKQ